MADKMTFYKRLRKLGACSYVSNQMKGKYFKEVWDTWKWSSHAEWLLTALASKGYLKHPDIVVGGGSGYRYGILRGALKNAYYYADPSPVTRRQRFRDGPESIAAIKECISFRTVSRALAKIKV